MTNQKTTSDSVVDIPFPRAELDRLDKRKWILRHAKTGGIGAEIGVFRGHFSTILAEILKPKTLFLVDPWTKLGPTFGWGEESEYTGFGRLTTKYAYDDVIRRVAPFKDSIDIRVIEAFALEFLASLKDKLDWVYLDASHAYKSTLGELNALDRAMAPDGLILGDDWQPNPAHMHHGVFRAVQEFTKGNWEILAAGPAGQWCIRRRKN